MPKKIAILQSNYIPWKGYFDLINCVDEFVIYDDMQYTKRDWRNRNKIKTSNGSTWLTIPVEVKGKFTQKIRDTKVSDPKWNEKHWNTIKHNYNNTPFFKHYAPSLEELYIKTFAETRFLSEINYALINHINQTLGIKTPIKWSSDYTQNSGKTERLLGICLETGADTYVSGPAAQGYLDTQLFKSKGVNVTWMDYSEYPKHPQLHPPFEHQVSILDLIFNTGPEATRYMKTFNE